MYVDEIELFAKKGKIIDDFNTSNENIQSGYRNGIRHRKMCHANTEKRKKTNSGRSKTAKSRKNQKFQRKRRLQVLGNIGSGHHQTSEDEKKKQKQYLSRSRKLLETKLYRLNLIKGMNTWAVSFVRYSGLFLKCTREVLQKMDQWLCTSLYSWEMT